jgi:tRNA(fMet)-specific endonuclease VapC
MGLILDTCFVVAVEREARRGQPGPAMAFLEKHPAETLAIPFTVAGELACGQSASARRAWELLCRPYPVLPWTKEIAWQYGEIYRALAARSELIGANDMWIAATALAQGLPVVTNNVSEFSRVPGLSVKSF